MDTCNVYLIHFSVHLKPTQNHKSTTYQLKKKKAVEKNSDAEYFGENMSH